MHRSAPFLVALVLALVAPHAASAAGPLYVTGSGAAKLAVTQAAARLDGATLRGTPQVGCAQPELGGAAKRCTGYFAIELHGRRAYYVLLDASRVARVAPGEIEARIVARRHRHPRGFPARLRATAVQRGEAPPAERIVHANLVLDRSEGEPDYGKHTLSRSIWVGFPVPFFWTQAYDEGPVRAVGFVERSFDSPPGGTCTLRLGLGATLQRARPVERDGELVYPGDPDSGTKIHSRLANADGSTTWMLEEEGFGGLGVRAGPAPPGLGPAGLGTLVLTGSVETDLERFGEVTANGYPPLDPTTAQIADCNRRTAIASATLLPRSLALARPSARPHPPKIDPNEEEPTPIEPG